MKKLTQTSAIGLISTENTEGNLLVESIERQGNDIFKFARQKNIYVEKLYFEIGISGYGENSNYINNITKDCKNLDIKPSFLVVESYSRLTSTVEKLQLIQKQLKSLGIKIFSITESHQILRKDKSQDVDVSIISEAFLSMLNELQRRNYISSYQG